MCSLACSRGVHHGWPTAFRVLIEVGDLNRASGFYTSLLDIEGRPVQGGRAYFQRAQALDCLAPDDVHGAPAGEIAVRPWGERSFSTRDFDGNALCFVDTGTRFTGR